MNEGYNAGINLKWGGGREDLNLRPPAPKACVQFINPHFN